MNDNELSPCPFCEGNLIEFGSDIEGDKIVKLYIHPELSDDVKRCPLTRLVFKAGSWQRRPIEDAQATEIARLSDECEGMRQEIADDCEREDAQRVEIERLNAVIEAQAQRIAFLTEPESPWIFGECEVDDE